MAGEKILEGDKGLGEFLVHMDKVLEKARAIYDMGESCSVYFRVGEYYEIPESEKELAEFEIKKRDVGTPELDWWKGFLDRVKVNNPWG